MTRNLEGIVFFYVAHVHFNLFKIHLRKCTYNAGKFQNNFCSTRVISCHTALCSERQGALTSSQLPRCSVPWV